MDIGGALGSSYQGGDYVATGSAVLDVTAGATVSISGTLAGSGNGTIELAGGVLAASAAGATLKFASPLQWSAGAIDGSLGTVTNAVGSTLKITGQVDANGALDNAGTMTVLSGLMNINDGSIFTNLLGALFEITEDFGAGSGDVVQNQATGQFINLGTLEREAGGGTAIVASNFSSSGIVQVTSGALSIPFRIKPRYRERHTHFRHLGRRAAGTNADLHRRRSRRH